MPAPAVGAREIEPPSVARDYVGQEVLANLTPETRHALGVLAHLGPFDQDLAREALGRDVDVASLLGGLPLVGTTSEGEWHLHALWQSLLERDVTAADVADTIRRAGLALLRRGRVGAAVLRLIDVEAWEDVPHAVVAAIGVVHPPVARDVVAGWFERFPPGVRTHPGACAGSDVEACSEVGGWMATRTTAPRVRSDASRWLALAFSVTPMSTELTGTTGARLSSRGEARGSTARGRC